VAATNAAAINLYDFMDINSLEDSRPSALKAADHAFVI